MPSALSPFMSLMSLKLIPSVKDMIIRAEISKGKSENVCSAAKIEKPRRHINNVHEEIINDEISGNRLSLRGGAEYK